MDKDFKTTLEIEHQVWYHLHLSNNGCTCAPKSTQSISPTMTSPVHRPNYDITCAPAQLWYHLCTSPTMIPPAYQSNKDCTSLTMTSPVHSSTMIAPVHQSNNGCTPVQSTFNITGAQSNKAQVELWRHLCTSSIMTSVAHQFKNVHQFNHNCTCALVRPTPGRWEQAGCCTWCKPRAKRRERQREGRKKRSGDRDRHRKKDRNRKK